MIREDTFVRELEEYLSTRAGSAHAGYLDEALAGTVHAPQRRWWQSVERLLPMPGAHADGALVRSRGVRLALVLVVLGLLAFALAVIGSRPRVPAPFGLARNGETAYSEDGDIWALEPVSGARKPIVTGPTYDISPAFSRDGTRLLFVRVETAVGPNTSRSLVVADPDGSGQRELVRDVPGLDLSDWSPDGRSILYLSRGNDGTGRLNIVDAASGATRAVDLAVSAESQFLGWRPPGGNEIVFGVGEHYENEVDAVRPDGSGLRRINVESASCECFVSGISPDGSSLVWTQAAEHGNNQVVLLNATTGAETRLPQPTGDSATGGPFSPDGSLIAYVRITEPQAELYAYQAVVARPDGIDLGRTLGPVIRLLPSNRDVDPYSLAFTPDGRALLANFGDVQDPDGTASTLWLLPVDGSPGTKLGEGAFAAAAVQRLAP